MVELPVMMVQPIIAVSLLMEVLVVAIITHLIDNLLINQPERHALIERF
jgi:hypothetical protein